jgi:hypothetical protein
MPSQDWVISVLTLQRVESQILPVSYRGDCEYCLAGSGDYEAPTMFAPEVGVHPFFSSLFTYRIKYLVSARSHGLRAKIDSIYVFCRQRGFTDVLG